MKKILNIKNFLKFIKKSTLIKFYIVALKLVFI